MTQSFSGKGWKTAADAGKGGGQADCAKGLTCTRSDCYFTHPPGWKGKGGSAASAPAAADAGKGGGGKADCAKGLACTRSDCYFTHPPGWKGKGGSAASSPAAADAGKGGGGKADCAKGLACTRSDCYFSHPLGWKGKGGSAASAPAEADAGKGGGGKADCAKGLACTRSDCYFTHPPGWKANVSAASALAAADARKGRGGMADCAAEAAPAAPAAAGKGKGKSEPAALEGLLLSQPDSDAARLPSAAVAAILEHALTIRNQFSVELQPLSRVGILLKGSADALCNARCVLSRVACVQDRFTVHRLIVGKYRFLEVSAEERELVDQLWQGRRVVVQKTGKLCIVQKLQVQVGMSAGIRLIATVKPVVDEEDEGLTFEEGAEGLLCWDTYGRPDAIIVEHKTLGSDALCQVFVRHCCSQVAPVEAVEVTALGGDYVRSRVTFDISAEPYAAERTLTLLDGRMVGSVRLKFWWPARGLSFD
ncbi:unnamed protein product [Effrenium voratum]|uniref:C3H1-type domain-containing protein n=1 Tax=Effrenium voratum TaxID=2562239 RepID=A0AA36JSZ5_9DINO|nr:unnamed protein product [Effrenium voratum]